MRPRWSSSAWAPPSPERAPPGQPGSTGSLPVADVAFTALIMILSTYARWALSARSSRWSLLVAAARAAPWDLSTPATSFWTRCASGKAQVTRPSTALDRRRLASDSWTWYPTRSLRSSLFAGEQFVAP